MLESNESTVLEEKYRLEARIRRSREFRRNGDTKNPRPHCHEGHSVNSVDSVALVGMKRNQSDYRERTKHQQRLSTSSQKGGRGNIPRATRASRSSQGRRKSRALSKSRSENGRNRLLIGVLEEKRIQGRYRARRKNEQNRQSRASTTTLDEDAASQDEERPRWSNVAPGAVWERRADGSIRFFGFNQRVAPNDGLVSTAPPLTEESRTVASSSAVARAEVVDDQALEDILRERVGHDVVQADVLFEYGKPVVPIWQRSRYICLLWLCLVAVVSVVVIVAVVVPSRSGDTEPLPVQSAKPLISTAPSHASSQSPSDLPTKAPTASPEPTSTPTSSPTATPPCLESLTAIFEAEREADVSMRRKYVLCSRTTYPIDVFVNGTIADTKDEFGNQGQFQYPLILRPNVTIQCGEDGRSENNCVLHGGDYGLFSVGRFFGFEVLHDVVVKGMKFVNSGRYSILLGQPGKVSFLDCIFMKNAAVAPILINLVIPDPPERQLRKITVRRDLSRNLQSRPARLSVLFESCTFECNSISRDNSFSSLPGVITAQGNGVEEINVRNSFFRDNNYQFDNEFGTTLGGYMIRNVGRATMTIENNCFLGNLVLGPGLVQHFGNSTITSNNNFVSGAGGEGTSCRFVALITNPQVFLPSGCLPAEAAACALAPTTPPTEVPSSEPSPALHDTPTEVPSRRPSSLVLPSDMPSQIPRFAPVLSISVPSLPTNAPSSILEGEYAAVLSSIGISGLDQVGSPQKAALSWIINVDPAFLTPDSPRFVQRYLLATFYYSTTTNGRSWAHCGKSQSGESSTCKTPSNWVSRCAKRWLSEEHECLWFGVLCGNDNVFHQDDATHYGLDLMPTWGFPTEGDVRAVYIDNTLPAAQIPSDLARLTTLRILGLRDNLLSGTIPPALVDGVGCRLLVLDLGNNFFTGTFPFSALNTTTLKTINIGANSISGTLGSEIGRLTNLVSINTGENGMSGPIPSEIGLLQFLDNMNLENNRHTGELPSEFGRLSLLTSLNGASNTLTGSLPSELFSLSMLNVLDLDSNRLNGTISRNAGNLTSLNELRLSRNMLTGTIPSEFGQLTNLRLLWLHLNRLTGPVPDVCSFVGPGFLEFLVADCLAGAQLNASTPCSCCTTCCNHITQACSLVSRHVSDCQSCPDELNLLDDTLP